MAVLLIRRIRWLNFKVAILIANNPRLTFESVSTVP